VASASAAGTTRHRYRSRRWFAIFVAPALMAVVVLFGLGVSILTGALPVWLNGRHPEPATPTFVGSEICAGCHQSEASLWRGSQHAHAMDHVNDRSVLGDFNDTTFEYAGVRSRFFRKDTKYFVETDGPDGRVAPFEVKYTFGVYPLQQYLIEFPDGRIQALSIAWDSRPRSQGGQRWFHLYPNENIRHDDVLHWTKPLQNWNFMCAECHSTGVRKNYDSATDRFATTWSEISVGCESCHGQGSKHVSWAKQQRGWWLSGKTVDRNKGLIVRLDERRDAIWSISPQSGNAARNYPSAVVRKEVETCGLCHARRGVISENWTPGNSLSDTHEVSILGAGLYQADGQMLDEVYNYGSFKQSKMFAAGVTCGDCHDPHSAKTRAEGNAVCSQCHAAEKYATAGHHHHETAKGELTCASCHMPTRTYMVVDRRHDHSFRIPRPDQSEKYGVTNACNDCHSDKPTAWAAAAIERWYGPARKGFQNYVAAFYAARNDLVDATALLEAVVRDSAAPAIARATALTELGSRSGPETARLAQTAFSDPDPMVRIAALDAVADLPSAQRWSLASPLLSDDIRGVRIRAASVFADTPLTEVTAQQKTEFNRAADEFIQAQKLNADRPEARSALGTFLARRGRLSPQFAVAAVNLADLYRATGRDSDGEAVLRRAIDIMPNEAGLHHSLGLALVRLKHPEQALVEFRRALEIEPNNARYAYVYAAALNSSGNSRQAIDVLLRVQPRHPADRDILIALVTFSRQMGDRKAALQYANRLQAITPSDRGVANLINELLRSQEGGTVK
jgi:predicted CXXCH cytochrome family protein